MGLTSLQFKTPTICDIWKKSSEKNILPSTLDPWQKDRLAIDSEQRNEVTCQLFVQWKNQIYFVDVSTFWLHLVWETSRTTQDGQTLILASQDGSAVKVTKTLNREDIIPLYSDHEDTDSRMFVHWDYIANHRRPKLTMREFFFCLFFLSLYERSVGETWHGYRRHLLLHNDRVWLRKTWPSPCSMWWCCVTTVWIYKGLYREKQ